MNRIIMRSNKAAGFFNIPAPSPLGVEFEQLKKNLEEHTKEKYKDREDLRKYMSKEEDPYNEEEAKDKKTFMLSPGLMLDYTNNQHDTMPYPDSSVPYSNGSVRWEV